MTSWLSLVRLCRKKFLPSFECNSSLGLAVVNVLLPKISSSYSLSFNLLLKEKFWLNGFFDEKATKRSKAFI